jgi:general secretion pathway protein F
MPVYRLTVTGKDGTVSRVVRQADELEGALRDLAARGLFVLEARELAARSRSRARPASLRSVVELAEGLAMLLGAGVTARDALQLLSGVVRRRDTRRLAEVLLSRAERGGSLFDAEGEGGPLFPPMYAAMLRLGERTGALERVVRSAASFARKRLELRDRLATALVYPVLVLLLAVAVVAFLAGYVGPRLAALPAAVGGETPAAFARLDRALAGLLTFLAASFASAGLLAAALFVTPRDGGRRALGPMASAGRWALGPMLERRDRLTLRLPLLGYAVTLFEGRSLAFALEALTSAGIPVEQALGESAAVVRNRALRASLARARDAVVAGMPLSAALDRAGVVPRDLSRWAAIGERSGDVSSVFAQVYASYAYRVDRFLAVVTSLIEPALVLAVGGVVVWIVLAILVPLFTSLGAMVP